MSGNAKKWYMASRTTRGISKIIVFSRGRGSLSKVNERLHELKAYDFPRSYFKLEEALVALLDTMIDWRKYLASTRMKLVLIEEIKARKVQDRKVSTSRPD